MVENLRRHLRSYGVGAWVYSRDSTLAANAWDEIESNLLDSQFVIFVISEHWNRAAGKQRELEITLDMFVPIAGVERFFPVVLNGAEFRDLPELLRQKNGLLLDAHNVREVAWKIASRIFPDVAGTEAKQPWKVPVPGQWLEIQQVQREIEAYFEIGDKLYFRALSPMGLFECYAPKLQGLYWIGPELVGFSLDYEQDMEQENLIPIEYRVHSMIEMAHIGWRNWHKQRQKEND